MRLHQEELQGCHEQHEEKAGKQISGPRGTAI